MVTCDEELNEGLTIYIVRFLIHVIIYKMLACI